MALHERLQGCPVSSGVVEAANDNASAISCPVEHLLAVTDFTENSICAIDRALERGNALGAQITLLHVVAEGLPRKLTKLRQHEARELLTDYAGSLCAETRNDITINVRTGDPFLEIIRESIELGSDAIILGLEKPSVLDSKLAATAIDVITFSDKPVLVVGEQPAGPYGRAVIAVDPCVASGWAIRATQRLAPQVEAHLACVAPTEAAEVGASLAHPFAASANSPELLMDCISQVEADLLVVGLHRAFQHSYDDLSSLLRRAFDTQRCDLLFVRNQ